MEDERGYYKIKANGPLEISGSFELFDSHGEIITRQGPIFLCRCGMSNDKPFCDGTHRKTGFVG